MVVLRTPIGDITTTMLYIGGQACRMGADGRCLFYVSFDRSVVAAFFLFGHLL